MNKQLKIKRAEKEITQAQLAELIQIHVRSYRGIENEGVDPKTSTALKIAKILNTTVEELFTSNNNTNK